MMPRSTMVFFAFAAVLFSGAASAQQFNTPRTFYAGGSLGHSDAQRWCLGGGGANCDDTKVAVKAFGGYQLDQTFAVEVGLVHLGKFTASFPDGRTDEAKVQALEASIVASWPVAARISLFGRFGGYYATVRETTRFAGSFSNNNSDLTFGFGVRYNITPRLAVRGEWQRYLDIGGPNVALGRDTGDLSSADMLGIGVLWRF